jgi:NAD(P)-dependent dehydrogenase (short-subunit alcohol dehydrogenase family)
MKIAVLGAGAVGSTIGRLWHAAGHDVTFAARHATRPRALAAELGGRAHAASVADAVAPAEVVLVADPLTAPFEKFRDHAPDNPAFFLGHLSHAVFEAGIWRAVDAKWDGIREAFHGFDPAQVAAMTPAEIAATENDPRVIRNKAKIRATVENAREVLAVLDSYGSIRAYFASFPDARAASADMRRRFKFLGDTGVWRLLIGAARDIGG